VIEIEHVDDGFFIRGTAYTKDLIYINFMDGDNWCNKCIGEENDKWEKNQKGWKFKNYDDAVMFILALG
jgi:hypothetical protein